MGINVFAWKLFLSKIKVVKFPARKDTKINNKVNKGLLKKISNFYLSE